MASYLLCCFLLHLLFGAVLAGTEKFAYSGMCFKLFTNLTFQNRINLYRNGNEESVIIGIWEVKNAAFTSTFLNHTYTGKIFMEIDKTPFILICNVDQTLAAKYLVIYDIDTPGPELELKIIGNLTEDEFHKLLDDDLGFMKKYFGNLTGEQIGQIRKLQDEYTEHIKEFLGNLTGEQIGQIKKLQDEYTEHIKEFIEKVISEQIPKMLPSNHPKEVLKESSDKGNPLILGLLIVICIIVILILIGIIILLCIQANRIKIREGLINMKDWIQKKLCCQCKFENEFRPQGTAIDIKEPDAHENDRTPTLDELSVTLAQQSWTGIEGNQNQSVSTQEMFNATQHSGIQIREGLINMKDWIQKKFCSQHWLENVSQTHDTVIAMEEPELSRDQVHTWLNDHPDFMDKYLGKLTEDQICMQIRKWEDAYPGLLKNKALDAHENDRTPTLDELSVTLTQHSGTGIEGNPNQSVSTQEMFNATQHSDEDQSVRPTVFEPLQEQMKPSEKTFDDSQSSDELEQYDTTTKTTLNDLGVTLCGPGSETEDNQGQMESSQEDVITCSSRSSATLSVPGPSGIQPFNKDKQDANPEQDTAQYVRVDIEDLDSDDKCKVPLLKDEAKM